MDNLTKAIVAYAQDPENAEKNYVLARLYHDINQTAAAISYYLRAAERTDDKTLAYECLVQIGRCFESQGGRGNTVRGAYKHALCLLPHRPEAYYLLARYYEKTNDHVSGYLFAEQGLQFADFTLPPLRSWVEYYGDYSLLFQKAVSAWWWGKPAECRQLFSILWVKYELDDMHRVAVENNLKNLGIPYDPQPKKRKALVDEDKMDIVLQGPYTLETDNIITEYLALPFVNRVIVSHWKDDLIVRRSISSRVVYVPNEKPMFAGTDNRNMQIVSSRNGIAEVETKFAAKMRTDQRYDAESMKTMYDFMMKHHKPRTLFVAGMYNNLLFHPRDHIFWGLTEDLVNMFDCPLELNGVGDRVRISKEEMHKYTPFYTRSETYLGAHYISRFVPEVKLFLVRPELYLYDYAPNWQEAKVVSDKTVYEYFKPFPRKGIDFKWTRKGWDSYPYELQAASGESWAEELPTDFDMGANDEFFKRTAYKEVVLDKLYEKFHPVKEGDIVVDIGSNVGLFPYSLKNRKPRRVICVEPSTSLYDTLKENLNRLPFETWALNYGIGDEDGVMKITGETYIYGKPQEEFKTKTFKGFLEDCEIDHIDFLKVDCEGGEYSIFTKENFEFLTTKVKYISGEWHFSGIENAMTKFKEFRDTYLKGRKFRVFEPYRWKEVTDEIFDDDYLQRFYDFWHPHNGSAQLQVYIENV